MEKKQGMGFSILKPAKMSETAKLETNINY